jgi:hypothetical protein
MNCLTRNISLNPSPSPSPSPSQIIQYCLHDRRLTWRWNFHNSPMQVLCSRSLTSRMHGNSIESDSNIYSYISTFNSYNYIPMHTLNTEYTWWQWWWHTSSAVKHSTIGQTVLNLVWELSSQPFQTEQQEVLQEVHVWGLMYCVKWCTCGLQCSGKVLPSPAK